MTTPSFADRTSERNAMWLFVGVVAVAYIGTVMANPQTIFLPKTMGLVALGIIYVLIGVYGAQWCESRRGRGALVFYFVFQIILSALIIHLSWDYAGLLPLIVFPLVSQATMAYPLWGVGVITGVIVLLLSISLAISDSWTAAIQTGLGILVGLVFIIIFTRIAAREYIARLEVERLAGELQDANRKLRAYAVQAEELATMQERNRLAREIHDSLGHYLTVVNVQLEAAKTVLVHDPDRALSAVEKAQTLTKNGLADVRRSVATLRASPLDNVDLPEAIEPLLDECRASGLSAQLTITGTPVALDPQPKLTLYRVIQEGLTNVQKHAQAGRVDVTLDYSTPGVIHLTIADDGSGMAKQHQIEGFGLLGIRERVNLLGGTIETRSRPGQGFALIAKIPVTTDEAVTNGDH